MLSTKDPFIKLGLLKWPSYPLIYQTTTQLASLQKKLIKINFQLMAAARSEPQDLRIEDLAP